MKILKLDEHYIKRAKQTLEEALFNMIFDDDFCETNYGAIDEEDEEQTQLNCIDNGYCVCTCMYISDNFSYINGIQYFLLDNGSDSFHCLMKHDEKYYDAYNYDGVNKLEELKFVEMYMPNYNEEQLQGSLKFISQDYFDENKEKELKKQI